MDLKAGDLYRVIDSFGIEVGLAIFVEMIAPHTLSEVEGVHKPAHWNMKVLVREKIMYLDTSNWTLLPTS